MVNQEAKSPSTSSTPVRNLAARASLVWALAVLLPTLVLLAGFALGKSSPPFLQNAADATLEMTFLCFPLYYLALPIPMILGVVGWVRARRLPGKVGQVESIAGAVLGLIVLALSGVNFVLFASAFKQ